MINAGDTVEIMRIGKKDLFHPDSPALIGKTAIAIGKPTWRGGSWFSARLDISDKYGECFFYLIQLKKAVN